MRERETRSYSFKGLFSTDSFCFISHTYILLVIWGNFFSFPDATSPLLGDSLHPPPVVDAGAVGGVDEGGVGVPIFLQLNKGKAQRGALREKIRGCVSKMRGSCAGYSSFFGGGISCHIRRNIFSAVPARVTRRVRRRRRHQVRQEAAAAGHRRRAGWRRPCRPRWGSVPRSPAA